MNTDEISGAVQKTGGKIRSKVDGALGDKKGKALGIKDQAAGAMKESYGKAKDSIKKAAGE